MPNVVADGITLRYEVAGSGPPLVLIPFLGADCSCYGFQVPDYARHFTCYSVDLRGAGGSDKPEDRLTSTRFAPAFDAIRGRELAIFDGCAHAPISEDPATFNARTLAFLLRHARAGA